MTAAMGVLDWGTVGDAASGLGATETNRPCAEFRESVR